MKKTVTVTNKICNRCKVEKNLSQFLHKNIERVYGIQHWVHPWCNECRAWVKEKWGINWIGGLKNGTDQKTNKEKTSSSISNISRRTTNKTVHSKRIGGKISKSNNKRYKLTKSIQRRTSSMSNKNSTGTIIKTLKKIKDNVEK